jgi:hypothetical protein
MNRFAWTTEPLRRLRRHLPITGEEYFSFAWTTEPLRRLRRHLPMNGEEFGEAF